MIPTHLEAPSRPPRSKAARPKFLEFRAPPRARGTAWSPSTPSGLHTRWSPRYSSTKACSFPREQALRRTCSDRVYQRISRIGLGFDPSSHQLACLFRQAISTRLGSPPELARIVDNTMVGEPALFSWVSQCCSLRLSLPRKLGGSLRRRSQLHRKMPKCC